MDGPALCSVELPPAVFKYNMRPTGNHSQAVAAVRTSVNDVKFFREPGRFNRQVILNANTVVV
jgi:hypothetical protein